MAVVGAIHVDVAECPSVGLSAMSSLLQGSVNNYRDGLVIMLFDQESKTYTNASFIWDYNARADFPQAMSAVLFDAFDTLKENFPNSYYFGRLPKGRKHLIGDWTSFFRGSGVTPAYGPVQFAGPNTRYHPRNVALNSGSKTNFPYTYLAPEAFFAGLKHFEATVWSSILNAFAEDATTKQFYHPNKTYSVYDTFNLQSVRNFHQGIDREESTESGYGLLSHKFKLFHPDEVRVFYSLEYAGNSNRRQDVVVLDYTKAAADSFRFPQEFRRFLVLNNGQIYWCENRTVPFAGFEEASGLCYAQVFSGQLVILVKNFDIDPTLYAQAVLSQLRGQKNYLQQKIQPPRLKDLATTNYRIDTVPNFVELQPPEDLFPKIAMVSRVSRGVYNNYPSEVKAAATSLLSQSNLGRTIRDLENTKQSRLAAIEKARRDIQFLQQNILENEAVIATTEKNIAHYKSQIFSEEKIAETFLSILPVDRTAQNTTASFINFCAAHSILIHQVMYITFGDEYVTIPFVQVDGKSVPNVPANFNPFQVRSLAKLHFTMTKPIVNVLDSKPKEHISLVGPFEVLVDGASLNIRGLDNTIMYSTGNYKLHPHIATASGLQNWVRPCTGTFGTVVSPFIESGDVLSTLKAAVSWLKNNTGPEDAWSNDYIRYFLSQSPLHDTLRGLVNLPRSATLPAEKVLAPIRGYYNEKDGSVSVLVENIYASLAREATALEHYDPTRIAPYALITLSPELSHISQTDTHIQINFPEIFSDLKKNLVWDCKTNTFRANSPSTKVAIKTLKTMRFRFDYKIPSEHRLNFDTFILPISIEKKTKTTKVEAQEASVNA